MKMDKKPRVLVVATSRKTRGGITSVIKAHEQGEQWRRYNCRWIETHIDKNAFIKVGMQMIALLKYMFYLPWSDIVHLHLSGVTSSKRKKMFMSLALLFHKKIIVHFHAFSTNSTINGKYSNLYKYLFTNADAVVVLSNYWRNAVNEKYNLEGKVKVIYNPCMIADYLQQYKKTKSILYAGTLNQRKGYADFIAAFGKVAKKNLEWKIVFAGNGEIENGVRLAKELSIEDQCVFLGWVTGDEKDKAYKEASIFCLPSYAEGFPMAVLDAWAYGLPVITTPVGGIPDVAVDGENMLLFEPGDIDKLAGCLERMIADENLRADIGKESLKLAATTFNVTTICRQIGELYEELILERN